MTLLEQLRKPEEVKRWFDQIGDQAANEIESLQQQLVAATRSKNEMVVDLYRRLDLLDDLNLHLKQRLAKMDATMMEVARRDKNDLPQQLFQAIEQRDDLARQVETMVDERGQLQAEIKRLDQLLYGARCVYCNEIIGQDQENQDIGDLQLQAHIEVCEKHPVAKYKAQLQAVTEERDNLRLRIKAVDAEHDDMARQKHKSIAAFQEIESQLAYAKALLAVQLYISNPTAADLTAARQLVENQPTREGA